MPVSDLYPRTPDGRYFVVRGRLWRASNPALDETRRQSLVDALMSARRAVRAAKGDPAKLALARSAVDDAKIGLGERGPVWWTDGAPDLNRRMVANTSYSIWYDSLNQSAGHDQSSSGNSSEYNASAPAT